MAITTNTNKHISDKANSVTIDKTNTIWKDNSNINTVQDALESLQPIAIKEVHATDKNYGLVRLAKDIDLENLRGTNDVVTSKQMFEFNGKPQADYTTYGTTRYATQQETASGTSEVVSINAKQLQYKFDNTTSTRTRFGTIKLADESMVVPGTNDNTVMTPKLVKLAIDRLVPVPEVIIADEQLNGTVTLANVAVTQQGTIRKGYAVSPYAFKNTNATTTIYGTVRSATLAEVRAGAIADKAVVTPKTFIDARATTSQVGTTQLATTAEAQSATISNKAVTPSGLKYLKDKDGYLQSEIDKLKNEINYIKDSMDIIPVGTIIATMTSSPIGRGWLVLNRPRITITQNTHPKLYDHLKGSITPINGIITIHGGNGKVLRGVNNGEYSDVVNTKVNDVLMDTMQRMTGTFNVDDEGTWNIGGVFRYKSWGHGPGKTGGGGIVEFDNARQARTSSENRPKSLSVIFQIYAGV